jgi:hypothetical protein
MVLPEDVRKRLQRRLGFGRFVISNASRSDGADRSMGDAQ